MSDLNSVQKALGDLKVLAPKGFALAFQIDFTTPTFLFQTYPKEWICQYSEKGLVMSDPTVAWGFENEGYVRWSELSATDAAGVLSQAAEHGLVYGLTCSVSADSQRSFASFARSDREFTDDEARVLLKSVADLHKQTAEIKANDPDTTLALQKLSAEFSG